jgi:hypothetical protein
MAKIKGRFYFKRTSNGNLVGEFSNDAGTKTFTESSDLVGPDSGSFVGQYHSTWQENRQSFFAELTIKPDGSLLKLAWLGATKFEGRGMLCDDILIGDYNSVP